MYTALDREQLLNKIIEFMKNSSEFEGLLQIGSGALGFADIYSDIDLMAGCYDAECVKNADHQIQEFFANLDACHIEKRAWTPTALGVSVYFENGLSADISFMPTVEIPIKSPLNKIIFSKTNNFADVIHSSELHFTEYSQRQGVNDSIHYRFINELRYVEIALLRDQYIFADIALCNARQILLSIETVIERKKLHQFKAYNTLEKSFIDKLDDTYPKSRNYDDIQRAKEKLLTLYLKTIKKCDYLHLNENLLKLLGCFKEMRN